MKKMFTLFVALISFSALFAQYDRHNDNGNAQYNNQTTAYNDHNSNNRNGNYNGGNGGYDNRGYGNNDAYNRGGQPADMHRNGDMDRRDGGFDRRDGGYDRREGGYRNDPRVVVYDHDRGYDRMHRERNDRFRNIGGAVLVGGILGVVIGSHL